MTNKRSVAIDHTHEPATPDYNGFFSASDKALIDSVRAGAYLTTVTHDTTLTGDGTVLSPLGATGVLPLAGGTMSGTIISTPIGIIHGQYLGVTRGFLASDANGIGFLDNAAAWAVRVPLGTKNWEVIGKLRVAEGLTYSDANNSTIFNRYIVQKGGTALGTGYWVKYYDGTMMMWFTVTVTLAITTANAAAGGFTQSAATTLNFPENFVDANYSAVIGGGAGNIGGTINSKAAGSLTYFLRTITSSASASRTFEIQLMGRWY